MLVECFLGVLGWITFSYNILEYSSGWISNLIEYYLLYQLPVLNNSGSG